MPSFCIQSDEQISDTAIPTLIRLPTERSVNIYHLTLQDTKLGIDFVRSMIRRTMLKPNSQSTDLYIIDKAHELTEEAQNALLKTLEEPPESVCIILITNNAALLLPTILSRCIPISLESSRHTPKSENSVSTRFRNQAMEGRLLDSVANLTTKDAAINWLTHLMLDLENELLASDGMDVFSVYWLRNCTKAYEAISKNSAYKLVIDHLVTQTSQPPLGKRE